MVTTIREDSGPNEWEQRMVALAEREGLAKALSVAYADGMVFACEALGHPAPHGSKWPTCLCGERPE